MYGEHFPFYQTHLLLHRHSTLCNDICTLNWALWTSRLPGSTSEAQDKWAFEWIQAHIDDSKLLKKPFLIAEFGKSSKTKGFTIAIRDNYFGKIYGTIYDCAKNGGPCGGGLFWQLMDQGMANFGDGYEVVLQESPSTDRVILLQYLRLSKLSS